MNVRSIGLAIFCFALLGTAGARAQTATGFQQLAAGSLASATALTVPAGTRWAWICAEAQAVRWRDDGTNPTASVGMPLASGSCMQYLQPPGLLSFIQQTAGAILDVSYYK